MRTQREVAPGDKHLPRTVTGAPYPDPDTKRPENSNVENFFAVLPIGAAKKAVAKPDTDVTRGSSPELPDHQHRPHGDPLHSKFTEALLALHRIRWSDGSRHCGEMFPSRLLSRSLFTANGLRVLGT